MLVLFCSSGPISSGNPASHRLLSTFTEVKNRGLGHFCQEKVRFSSFFLTMPWKSGYISGISAKKFAF
jgi:hypothetical protein